MTASLFDITGKVALVTGSSRGIGKAIAKGLADAGAIVVLNGRGATALEQARADLAAEIPDAQVNAVPFDAADPDAVGQAVAEIETTIGPVDILVNNTGMQHRAPITEFTDEKWHALLQTNLTSAFTMSREVGRRMSTRRQGKIINICSVQSTLARPGIAPYSATKGGLAMLTKGLCSDLGPAGIQVNAVAPGYFNTELTAALVENEEFTSWVEKRTPAGRWGDVEDLIGTVIYLSSDASRFVGGQTIYVDGGMTSVL